MKTTEIFVEQVLIGFMVLLVLAAPFGPQILKAFPGIELPQGLALGAILTGLGYLLGIVVDRVVDTLTEDLESHNRARFTIRKEWKELATERPGDKSEDERDFFPEDTRRIQVMQKGGGLEAQMDYLRTRIRLCRALAVFLPAITFALVVGLLADNVVCKGPQPAADCIGAGWVQATAAVVYILVLLACIQGKRQAAKSAPRTNHREGLLKYAVERRLLEKRVEGNHTDLLPPEDSDEEKKLREKKFQNLDLKRSALYFAARILAVLTLLVLGTSVAIVDLQVVLRIAGLALGGFALAGLALWSWWRITKTFMLYVYDCGRVFDNQA